jgi:hypothetical protein
VKCIAALGLSAAALEMSAGCQGGEDSNDAGECAQSAAISVKEALGPYSAGTVCDIIAGTGDGSVHYSVFNHIGAPGDSVYEKLDAVIRALGGDPAVDSVWTALARPK